MQSRPSSRYQYSVGNRLPGNHEDLYRDTSIQHPPIDHLSSKIEGCVRELGRIKELRKNYILKLAKLEDQYQIWTSRMQGFLRLPQQTYSADGKVVKKDLLPPKVMTTNLPNQLSKAPIDYVELCLSSTEDSKNGITPLSSETSYEEHFPVVSVPELAEGSKLSSYIANDFHFSDARIQPTYEEDENSTPLITTLKKLKWQHQDYLEIKKWCKMVTELFFETDEDASGSIEEEEFLKMINKLPVNESLREKLRGKFKYIDVDKSGGISLTEFLSFVLQCKPFRTKLQENGFNDPYDCGQNLSFWDQPRLWVFKVTTTPDFNIYSKVLFFLDFCLSFVPIVTLFLSALNTSVNELLWDGEIYFYFISVFFAAEWVFKLILCKRRSEFLMSGYHILELLSFLPFIIYRSAGYAGEDIPLHAFVILRILRVLKLSHIFPLGFSSLKEQLDIYKKTLSLAYMSYKGLAVFMVVINLFLSTLVFAFERGTFDQDLKVWIRAGESSESPFSDFFNCCYFILVTATTLGYGDMSPTSYVGKLIALTAVALGLVNISFFINTIGDCFEEVLRNYLNIRTRELELKRKEYILQNVNEAKTRLQKLYLKRNSKFPIIPNIFIR